MEAAGSSEPWYLQYLPNLHGVVSQKTEILTNQKRYSFGHLTPSMDIYTQYNIRTIGLHNFNDASARQNYLQTRLTIYP
jgi:hypothetical protein